LKSWTVFKVENQSVVRSAFGAVNRITLKNTAYCGLKAS